MPILLAEVASGDNQVINAIKTACEGVMNDAKSGIVSILPYAIGIMGITLVVFLILKFFNRTTKSNG